MIEFQLIKQRDDYLRVVFTIQNSSGQTLWFKPADATSTGYGFLLVPPAGLTPIRQTGVPEAGMVMPVGGKAGLDIMWGLIPPASSPDWAWSLEIHGLMVGERALPTFTLPMPAFSSMPKALRRDGRDKSW